MNWLTSYSREKSRSAEVSPLKSDEMAMPGDDDEQKRRRAPGRGKQIDAGGGQQARRAMVNAGIVEDRPEARPGGDGDHRPEAAARGDSQDVGARHGVAEQPLHHHAADGKGGAHEHGGERAGQPQEEQDGDVAGVGKGNGSEPDPVEQETDERDRGHADRPDPDRGNQRGNEQEGKNDECKDRPSFHGLFEERRVRVARQVLHGEDDVLRGRGLEALRHPVHPARPSRP